MLSAISSKPDENLMSRLPKLKPIILRELKGSSPNTSKSIHTKMLAKSLSNDLLEKMLFMRYNSLLVVGAVRRLEVMQEDDDFDLYDALNDAEED